MRTFFRKLGQIGWSFPVIVALLALCLGGVLVIGAATASNDSLRDASTSQFKYMVAGFAVYLVLALTPYRFLVKISPFLYFAAVAFLVAVFIPGLGRKVYGASSWLRLGPISFEPSEFAKLASILFLAWFLRVRERKIHYFSTVAMAAVLMLVPFILIKEQPALGSASVFIPICICMLFAAGARWYYIVVPLALVAAVVMGAYYWIHVWDKPVPFLKDYQLFRAKVFFDPDLDPKGAGWQIDQSMIAIGSGGMNGKGMDGSSLTALGYLPKNTSYNDLIFSVVGELFGFRGGAPLIICEGTVLLWCLWVAARARDKIGALVAVGVMAMLFTHIFVNIGMTIQVVPITGIPLPFISYGGTFLVACFAAMGLVQSVWVHRKNFERI